MQFLDADDLLLPTKLEKCLHRFAEQPVLGVVYTDYDLRSPDLSASVPVERPGTMPEGQVLAALFQRTASFFNPACPLIRREAVEAIGFFDERLRAVEDWQYWVRLAAGGFPFGYVPERLVWYRDTPQSMSKDPLRMATARLMAVEGLRGVPLPPEIDLPGKIADRHHALAMVLWEQGDRRSARQHLAQARVCIPRAAGAVACSVR
ncbi:MAG: glycosyltransferase [Anaerolineae bacterium]|nr:glycosyltransferase [Anaerolineae bacterium]